MTVDATPGIVTGRGRVASLDGLRGLAASVVVIHHTLLVAPELAQAYGTGREGLTGWAWWLTHTPLHLLWDGPASVDLFFVLSGFVLALPFLGSERPSWRDYYPRRIARLYLPVWGAIILGLLLIALIPRHASADQSWWINARATPLSVSSPLRDAVLVFGAGAVISPLWSLRYEVVFSALLPAYLVVAQRFRRASIALLAIIALCVAFPVNDLMFYLPMFGIGVVMSSRRDVLDRIAGRIWGWRWVAVTVAALLLTNAQWYPVQIPGATLLTVVGVSMIVFVFYGCHSAGRVAAARPIQWLGKRSFSLYLVHEPIVVALAMLTGSANPVLSLALSVPTSLVVAAAFYRWIECPAHLFAKRLRVPTRLG